MAPITDAPTPPPDWGPFGRRILEWWNTLADFVNQLRTDADTNASDIAAIEAVTSWDPGVTGLTFSTESGSYQRSGDWITAVYRGTISGVDGAGTFITFTLPAAMTGFVTGDILSWGEAAYQDVNTVYIGKPRADSSTVVSVRPQQADGIGTGAWRSDGAQPVATFSAGDVLSFAITYRAA